tara:strand:- start:550 stop:933 length:384 start_codon:yes stop_codon:yes gene_type:complete
MKTKINIDDYKKGIIDAVKHMSRGNTDDELSDKRDIQSVKRFVLDIVGNDTPTSYAEGFEFGIELTKEGGIIETEQEKDEARFFMKENMGHLFDEETLSEIRAEDQSTEEGFWDNKPDIDNLLDKEE